MKQMRTTDLCKSKMTVLYEKVILFVTDKTHIVLAFILATGAYLRIWNIGHLFNVVHDYDEGVYSLAARFMLQGFQPYKDFTLVHPPLFELALTGVYRIFGYNFMYGKYFSVSIALLSILLIYLIGKKLYHRSAGIVAALFFAVSPDMVYPGRRVVQESLGIFLLLIAIYFATEYFDKRKPVKILFCGIFLGLTVATKYIFIPSVIGVLVAVVLLSLPKSFRESIKIFGTGPFWLIYISTSSLIVTVLLALKWIFRAPISIPLIDRLNLTTGNFLSVLAVFILPLIPAIYGCTRTNTFKEWVKAASSLIKLNTSWLLVGGIIIGFFSVTGYYLVTIPGEFIRQTIFMQEARPFSLFPSFLGMLQGISNAEGFLKMAFLPILLTVPLVLFILRKREVVSSDYLVSISLLFTFIFCQFMFQLPRYYISSYPFIILGFASFTPVLNLNLLKMKFKDISMEIKTKLLCVSAVIILALCLSLVLLTNYTGYDIISTFLASNEEYVYSQTVSFLEQAGAQKIYALNPIFTALSVKLNSSMKFDSFELLWLENIVPDELIQDQVNGGVDYVVLDSWVRWWTPPYKDQADKLVKAVRLHGKLVKIIAAGEPTQVEIYLMTPEISHIINGDFENWINSEGVDAPLGWTALSTVTENGDSANMEQASVSSIAAVQLSTYETGISNLDYDSIYAALYQMACDFPLNGVKFKILPTESTHLEGGTVLGPGIHFVDSQGNAIVIGFSDKISSVTTTKFSNGTRMLVLLPAVMNQWDDFNVDISAYWADAGWSQPDKIDLYVMLKNDSSIPGSHVFAISSINELPSK